MDQRPKRDASTNHPMPMSATEASASGLANPGDPIICRPSSLLARLSALLFGLSIDLCTPLPDCPDTLGRDQKSLTILALATALSTEGTSTGCT